MHATEVGRSLKAALNFAESGWLVMNFMRGDCVDWIFNIISIILNVFSPLLLIESHHITATLFYVFCLIYLLFAVIHQSTAYYLQALQISYVEKCFSLLYAIYNVI